MEASSSHSETMLEAVASFVTHAPPEAIAALKETHLISAVLFRESSFTAGHGVRWQVRAKMDCGCAVLVWCVEQSISSSREMGG